MAAGFHPVLLVATESECVRSAVHVSSVPQSAIQLPTAYCKINTEIAWWAVFCFPSVDPRSEDCKIISSYKRRDAWLCRRGGAESTAERRADFYAVQNARSPTVYGSAAFGGLTRVFDRQACPCCAAISGADESSNSASATQIEPESFAMGV